MAGVVFQMKRIGGPMIIAGGPPPLRAICAARSTVGTPAKSSEKARVTRSAFFSSNHFAKMIPQLISERTIKIPRTIFVAPVEFVTSSIGELGIAWATCMKNVKSILQRGG